MSASDAAGRLLAEEEVGAIWGPDGGPRLRRQGCAKFCACSFSITSSSVGAPSMIETRGRSPGEMTRALSGK
jgi:hypothetical protein